MSEIVSWPEGSIYLWTGTATASALIGYATDVNAMFNYGVDNFRTLDTAYHDRYTGQRVDLYVGALWVINDLVWQKMADAKTAVHVHLKHSNGANESGGRYLYSGAIDAITLAGRERGLFQMGFQYHANLWSAY